MIDTEALRKKVLDLAVEGQLTEHNLDDGSASALKETIIEERKEYTKAKKIKKDSLDSKIENPPNKNLPSNWVWMRFCDLRENINYSIADGPFGSNLKRSDYTTEKQVRIIQLGNIGTNGWRNENKKYTTFDHLKVIQRSEVYPGNIVIAKMMPAGRAIIVPEGEKKYVLSADCIKFVPHHLMNTEYLCYAINSSFFNEQVLNEVSGIGRVRTSVSKIKKYWLPIPPLDEQDRIVEKINEVFLQLDIIDDLQSQYADNASSLKQKLLDVAVRGNLVPQNPADEPASVLLQKIAEEKKKLVKEGKIKKQKKLPEIKKEEIPFDIPESWEWARIGNVFNLQAGKNKKSSEIFSEQTEKHRYPCFGGNGLRGYVDNFNRKGHFALIGRQGALCGNINFADEKFYATEHAVVVEYFAECDVLWSGLFLRALNLNQYSTATAQPGLAVSKINNVLIPVPPVAEQKRIVAKIEEIFNIISNFEI